MLDPTTLRNAEILKDSLIGSSVVEGDESISRKKKQKEYHRLYYLNNKDRLREWGKNYYQKNREKVRAQRHRYYIAHRDEAKKRAKRWKSDNPERRRQIYQNYETKNPEKVRQAKAKYVANHQEEVRKSKETYKKRNPEKVKEIQIRSRKKSSLTPQGRWKQLRDGARRRNLAVTITFDDFQVLWDKRCHYCGRERKTHGLDRIDSTIGYIFENIVPCCEQCNWAKGTLSSQDFILLCKLVSSKHQQD